MKKILLAGLIGLLTLAFTFGIVYAVSFTADAAESVRVPAAALGQVCLLNSETGACTATTGEVLFGNAVVRNFNGDEIGLVLIQFGGQLYRAVNFGSVHDYVVTLTDGSTVTVTPETLPKLEGQIESVEEGGLRGLAGTLSQVLPDGNEVYTTGEVRIMEGGIKGPVEEEVPVGRFYILYNDLVLEDSDECGPYSYLDENGEPVKGISTRECVGRRGVMTAGEYVNLEFILNAPGGQSSKYKLIGITSTTSFDWEPEATE